MKHYIVTEEVKEKLTKLMLKYCDEIETQEGGLACENCMFYYDCYLNSDETEKDWNDIINEDIFEEIGELEEEHKITKVYPLSQKREIELYKAEIERLNGKLNDLYAMWLDA